MSSFPPPPRCVANQGSCNILPFQGPVLCSLSDSHILLCNTSQTGHISIGSDTPRPEPFHSPPPFPSKWRTVVSFHLCLWRAAKPAGCNHPHWWVLSREQVHVYLLVTGLKPLGGSIYTAGLNWFNCHSIYPKRPGSSEISNREVLPPPPIKLQFSGFFERGYNKPVLNLKDSILVGYA